MSGSTTPPPVGAVMTSSWWGSKLTGTITKHWHVMSSRLVESKRVANTIRPDRRELLAGADVPFGAYTDGAGPVNQHLGDHNAPVLCKPTNRNEMLGDCSLEFPASFPDWLCRPLDITTPVSIQHARDPPMLIYWIN